MHSKTLFVIASVIGAHIAGNACAIQFPSLAPGYTQEIYTGPLVGGPGMAWTSANALLSRNGSDIIEYNLAQTINAHQGTNLHTTAATHTVTGLSNVGYGMTNGLDGYIYTNTNLGLQRFDPNNWAAPAQTMPGSVAGLYGITTLPDGRIAYTDSAGSSNLYIYNPVAFTNTLIYTTPNSLIDGMVAGPTGNIAVTGQTTQTITIVTNTGTLLNTFSTSHYPDGLAFSDTASNSTLYSNNNDGTISKYVFGPGFTGTPTITDIASGSGSYGDLASVGPDCAFYVSQNENGNYHGATPGVGTNWDNGVTNSENSIVRIGFVGADGQPVCEFYSPIDEHVVPEPGTIGLIVLGTLPLILRRPHSSSCKR